MNNTDSPSQLIVALSIVVCATLLGLGSLVAFWMTKEASLLTIAATVAGGLLTALNAPTGIGKVVAAIRSPNQGNTP